LVQSPSIFSKPPFDWCAGAEDRPEELQADHQQAREGKGLAAGELRNIINFILLA
jgi:hypothetical protein